MSVVHVRKGPYVTRSEEQASEAIREHLKGAGLEGLWYVVSNWQSSNGPDRAPDDLDLVVVGATGIHLIEVKHWDRAFMRRKSESDSVENQARLLNAKAKRLKGRISRILAEPPYVQGKFLITRGQNERPGESGFMVEGQPVFGLGEWRKLLGLPEQGQPGVLLTDAQVELLATHLSLRSPMRDAEVARRLSGFSDLQLLSEDDEGLRKVYRASKDGALGRVILHLYDLTAAEHEDGVELARREWDACQALQKCSWVPDIVDSYQDANEYAYEVAFFSYADTAAPTLEERAGDAEWEIACRLETATKALRGLAEIHEAGDAGSGEGPILHRNLHPGSIRVRSDGRPLFTEFHLARVPGHKTVAGAVGPIGADASPHVAPEVRQVGLGASTAASDVYALCSSLRLLFAGDHSEGALAEDALEVLSLGLADEAGDRLGPRAIADSLEQLRPLATDPPGEPSVPALRPDFWDEETVKKLGGRGYRIMQKLGRGGVGIAFKVMEVGEDGEEASGPYVAKVFSDADFGRQALDGYARVRAHTGGDHLAVVFEVAKEHSAAEITALMKWLPGDSLYAWSRSVSLSEYVADFGEGASVQEAVCGWLADLCEGLGGLHKAGLVHGDVSPRNIIIDGFRIALTDYDLVTKSGSRPAAAGTLLYCAPSVEKGEPTVCSDDVYALAASFYHCLYGVEPFTRNGVRAKAGGLTWEGIDATHGELVVEFMSRATAPDPAQRFQDGTEAASWLRAALSRAREAGTGSVEGLVPVGGSGPGDKLAEQHAPWLDYLLRSYRGSPKGNDETRGLDSSFARDTYVTTDLDRSLKAGIESGAIRLVVLCGNVGDGKTALLQNLGIQLGVDVGVSANRLWEHRLPDGTLVKANLDGSAAFSGRSAEELLNEFLEPFSSDMPPDRKVHLVAVNDGPLLSWIEGLHEDHCAASQLEGALDDPEFETDPWLRFIHFNSRSLVGGVRGDGADLSTEFLDALVEGLTGRGQDHWAECPRCTAQGRCTAWQSVRDLRDPEVGGTLRKRLFRALQAVHVRGEMHITARELRGTLAYIFFGSASCQDLHDNPGWTPEVYWDRAFDRQSPHRQLDLLRELSRLDPARGADPRIDAELLRAEEEDALEEGREPTILASLRRQAYLRWSDADVEGIGGSPRALDLYRARHLDDFLRVVTGTPDDRREVCERVCEGLARLEDLPQAVLEVRGLVPLRVATRTPTETAFWVRKPLGRFELVPELVRPIEGAERLPTRLLLRYTFADTEHTEVLAMGAELFEILLDLRDGYQLSHVGADEVFANLSVFRERLALESDRTMFAYHPEFDSAYRIEAEDGDPQFLTMEEHALEAEP